MIKKDSKKVFNRIELTQLLTSILWCQDNDGEWHFSSVGKHIHVHVYNIHYMASALPSNHVISFSRYAVLLPVQIKTGYSLSGPILPQWYVRFTNWQLVDNSSKGPDVFRSVSRHWYTGETIPYQPFCPYVLKCSNSFIRMKKIMLNNLMTVCVFAGKMFQIRSLTVSAVVEKKCPYLEVCLHAWIHYTFTLIGRKYVEHFFKAA